jgi:hypothetical protein
MFSFDEMFPCDVSDLILRDLFVKEASRFSLTCKENSILVKERYKGTMEKLSSLKKWSVTFPNARVVNMRGSKIPGSDFNYMTKVETLDMSLCRQATITNESFQNLSALRHLNLQGACGHWNGGHHFTDELFDSLDLETLYIDDNHVITDNGIKKLANIRDLTIHNCSNIGNGISALHNLRKLSMYNLHKVTDDAFKPLIGIEELSITFMDVTDVAISYLVNLVKIKIMSCSNIKCVGFDKLKKLEKVDMVHGSIIDSDLVSLSNIKALSVYGCSINGSGFSGLKVKTLTIYESPIDDNLTVEKDICLNIYRCRLISPSKKHELELMLGNRFNTDLR